MLSTAATIEFRSLIQKVNSSPCGELRAAPPPDEAASRRSATAPARAHGTDRRVGTTGRALGSGVLDRGGAPRLSPAERTRAERRRRPHSATTFEPALNS